MRLPGELDQGAAPVGQSFAEVLRVEAGFLKGAAGLEVVHAQAGLAESPVALVELATDKNQALGWEKASGSCG